MLNKQLFLLRHAKSDWSVPCSDYERPLSNRGQRQSRLMAEWMQGNQLVPACIASSNSVRTRETIMNVCSIIEFDVMDIYWEEELYHANHRVLLAECVKFMQQYDSVMLVSHNPGLDDLLEYLCPENELTYTESGKLMTTAAFAQIELPANPELIQFQSGHLIRLQRPGELETE